MERVIDVRVRYHGGERLLRLCNVEGEWHAQALIPGSSELLTEEWYAPSPPGTKLPKMELNGFALKIEAPTGNVVSLGLATLLASGRVSVKDGWIEVRLRSIVRAIQDVLLSGGLPEQQSARILDFPTGRERGGREM